MRTLVLLHHLISLGSAIYHSSKHGSSHPSKALRPAQLKAEPA